jgi:hypothetical protein
MLLVGEARPRSRRSGTPAADQSAAEGAAVLADRAEAPSGSIRPSDGFALSDLRAMSKRAASTVGCSRVTLAADRARPGSATASWPASPGARCVQPPCEPLRRPRQQQSFVHRTRPPIVVESESLQGTDSHALLCTRPRSLAQAVCAEGRAGQPVTPAIHAASRQDATTILSSRSRFPTSSFTPHGPASPTLLQTVESSRVCPVFLRRPSCGLLLLLPSVHRGACDHHGVTFTNNFTGDVALCELREHPLRQGEA